MLAAFIKSVFCEGFPCGAFPIGGCVETQVAAEKTAGSFHRLQERRDPEVALPRDLREEDRGFFERLRHSHCAPTFVATLPGGLVARHGTVIAADGGLCRDVSLITGGEKQEHPLAGKKLPLLPRRNARAAVIASRGADCYYHWMLDTLPRLALLEGRGYDTLIAPQNTAFQKEALDLLGLRHRCADAPRHACRPYDTLVVPSLPGHSGMPTPEAIAWLRKTLGHKSAARRRIYISRGDVKKRRVLDEEKLIAALSPLGFENHRLEGLPLARQIQLFAGAEMVIAPHGASLTNIVFCEPGTPVIELFHPRYAHWCYWYLAAHSGLQYHYHVPAGSPAVSHEQSYATADIPVDVPALISQVRETLAPLHSASHIS